MESQKSSSLNINIDNYSGPLEVLLDMAKAQKVDLEKISITQLADQFIDFINDTKKINLDIASEYLLMATWLTYLKSKLLLPEDDEEDFKATEIAEKLGIKGTSSYVRVSQLKRQAIHKLIDNVDHSQVLDYL